MGKLFNRVRMTVSGTPGTGTITLLAATTGFQSFASAGVADADVVSYLIEDGTAWEYGQGTYTSSGTTLARTTVEGSSAGGTTKISATSNALVSITALASNIPFGGNVISYTPTVGHGGVAPTAENVTGSWYQQVAPKLFLVGVVYQITSLGSPTSYVTFTLPLSLAAAANGAVAVSTTSLSTTGNCEFVSGDTHIYFQPTAYAVQSFYLTALIPVQ